MSPPPMQSLAIQTQQKQCLASHFNIYPLIEKLSKEIETGNSDSLVWFPPQSHLGVSELKFHFENCLQMLDSISGSLGSKATTVDGQKRKLEETEKLLEQRRTLLQYEDCLTS